MICPGCGQPKEPTDFYAKQRCCKTCVKARARAWGKANGCSGGWKKPEDADKRRAYHRLYTEKNRDRINEIARASSRRNSAHRKAYRDAHKAEHRVLAERWRKANPEKVKASRSKAYRKNGPKPYDPNYQAKYRAKNRQLLNHVSARIWNRYREELNDQYIKSILATCKKPATPEAIEETRERIRIRRARRSLALFAVPGLIGNL